MHSLLFKIITNFMFDGKFCLGIKTTCLLPSKRCYLLHYAKDSDSGTLAARGAAAGREILMSPFALTERIGWNLKM